MNLIWEVIKKNIYFIFLLRCKENIFKQLINEMKWIDTAHNTCMGFYTSWNRTTTGPL